jgi:excinuclease ABC subunit C
VRGRIHHSGSVRQAVRDAQLFLEGRHAELERTLTAHAGRRGQAEQFEAAARLRDQLSTVHQLQEKQRIATAEQGDDADVFGYHFEDGSLAVNLFHVRAGKIVDRREFFWEDLPELLEIASCEDGGRRGLQAPKTAPKRAEGFSPEFHAGPVFSALLKQLYIDQQYVPRTILVPVEFDDREALAALLSERTGHRIELVVPQRGEKAIACRSCRAEREAILHAALPRAYSFAEGDSGALADALMLPELPRRIECFDISHIQGAETVASLVVWEDGKMNKSAYRKFKVMTVVGVDDFASMREVVHAALPPHAATPPTPKKANQRRVPANPFIDPIPSNGALAPEGKSKEPTTMPSLVLIDGGLGNCMPPPRRWSRWASRRSRWPRSQNAKK